MKASDQDDLPMIQALAQRYQDGEIEGEELLSLERRLKEDESFRTAFVDWLHLEGVLKADAGTLFQEEAGETSATSLDTKERAGGWGRRIVAAAAMVAVGLGVGLWWQPAPEEVIAPEGTVSDYVATLADIKAATWGSSSLPTAEGARLSPGRLDLVEGLATVRFDSGVTVTLEAPATLEVETAMRCRLVEGAAVAWVPDGAEGFQIETADALLTDYGTRFGVTASSEGQSEVLVLEGEVGVTHRKETGEKRLKTGEMVRYDAETLSSAEAEGGGETPRFGRETDGERENWIGVTTAEGRGKDTYVRQGNAKGPFGDSPLLMVKQSSEFEGNRRKAWLTFDLSGVDPFDFPEVELALSIQPSGLGYASVVPDSTFAVYGLLDETADSDWDETSLLWEDAPGNVIDHGSRLKPDQTVLLGEFVVEQGVSSGTRRVSGESLRDFLLSDSNGLVTFVIVRLTDETDRHGLVHAFASAEHPAAMAPTLRWRRPP